MLFFRAFAYRATVAAVLVAVLSSILTGRALAATSISGTVYSDTHAPVAGAKVTLTGNNLTLNKTTDEHGRFIFGGLNVGTYELLAETKDATAATQVDLGSTGESLSLTLLRTVAVVRTNTLPPVRGSGTDLNFNQQYIERSPALRDFPSLLIQAPGAARGANGVVHINGDHGDINYIVDGVPIPQELNRNIGSEFDTNNVSFVEILQGAYPAQYGNRFASVVNINTRVGSGPPGAEGYAEMGAYGYADSSAGYHGHIGKGSFVFNLRGVRSDRFLDPPNEDSPHNAGSNTNQFFRFTLPSGNDYLNVSLSHSYQAFQIPNDVAGGEPANTDDNETQGDFFGTVQFHHALRQGGSTIFGVGYKNSSISDFPDQANDFIYGQNLNLGNGGSATDCQSGTVSACADSLYSTRLARDFIFNVDNDVQSEKHDVKYGAWYDATNVQKLYEVTLQPLNFLAPIFTPATPNAPYTVVDNAPNIGHDEWIYLQDSWKMGNLYELDYGLRSDSFQVSSTQFNQGFAQLSPRIKFTRFFGPRASAYVYYGRFFTPFSLENVSPTAAQLLNLPNQPTVAQFDLRPQRDSDYEIGGHLPLGPGQLGLRVMQKNATDLIDDTQVGVTALHQDINYAQGRISSQSAYYQQGLPRGGRVSFSVTRTRSVNKGCETQLLAPCFGAPDDWTPADHDQTWDVNSGLLLNDHRGGWVSFSSEYGSGLSTAGCADTNILFCKVPPHLTFDVEKGIAIRRGTALTFTVQNLFNDRYRVTYLNAQGNHYAMPRTFQVGLQFGQH